MERFLEKCFSIDSVNFKMYSEGCSKEVLEELEIKTQDIDECVRASFETPGDFESDNKILREDKQF
jgi:hypothetical protein